MAAVGDDRAQSAAGDPKPIRHLPRDVKAPGELPKMRAGATPVGKELPGEKTSSAGSSELADGCFFFYARSVEACKQMIPTIRRLKRECFRIGKVDVGARPDLSKRYMITAVPTILIKRGREVVKITGLQDEQTLRSTLMRHKIEKEQGLEEPMVVIAYEIPASDLKSLASAIQTAVEPDSWEDALGEGKIMSVEEKQLLVIRQTRRVHRQIHAVLQGRRPLNKLERDAIELP